MVVLRIDLSRDTLPVIWKLGGTILIVRIIFDVIRIVRTDIPYTGGVRRPVRPDLNLSRIQDYFLEGGI